MKTSSFSSLLSLGLLCLWGMQVRAQDFPAGADNFSAAPAVRPEGGTSFLTDLTGFTTQAGEVKPSVGASAETAWWRWAAPESGFCVVDTVVRGWSFPNRLSSTLLAVYTGTPLASATRVAVGASYAYAPGGNFGDSALRFYAERGKVYYIQVSCYGVSATFKNVKLSVMPMPTAKRQREFYWTQSKGTDYEFCAGTFQQSVEGTLTGKLRVGTVMYPFAGAFDSLGCFSYSFMPKVKPGAPLGPFMTLQLDGATEGRYEFLVDGTRVASGRLMDKMSGTLPGPGTWAGIWADWNSGRSPVAMTVKANGTVAMVGTLADGTGVTYSGPILWNVTYARAEFGFSKVLSAGKGGVLLTTSFNAGAGGPFAGGSGAYQRPAKAGALFYPAGIRTGFGQYLYPYTKPVAGQRALGFLNATAGVGKLRVTDPTGEVGGTVNIPLTLGGNNVFVFNDPVRKPALKLNVTTGMVTGTVILGGKKRTLKGALVDPATPYLQGYVTAAAKNVVFEVIP